MRTDAPETYDSVARHFHWWTFAAVAIQLPLGLAMKIRGGWLDIWDALTNDMYSAHKLLGLVVFFVVAARLAHRLKRGAPRDEPTLEPWHKIVSHAVHWAIYGLLLATPLLGYLGVQLFPALDLFGVVSLPAFVSPDKAASAWVLLLHGIAAFALAFLLASHVGAALFHHFIRVDGVLARMIPWFERKIRRI
jgi:cytochrome b561